MRVSRREALAATAGLAVAASARAAGATISASTVDVAVIGAGVFGAWTAWHLRNRGITVRLLDQYGAGNARSSSGGESRVIRFSYGGDPLYSEMARESLAQWAALSDRLSLPILHRTGVLWFSPAGDSYMASSLAWLRANGIAHETGDLAWLRGRFPQIVFRDGESGFIESETGALIADRGVQAVVADAGLDVEQAAAAPPERASDRA
jgi:sarcosine oxidase